MIFREHVPATLVGVLLLAIPVTSLAQMTLTPAGISDGLTLSTFVSGFPTSSTSATGCCGPFGTASTSNGNILVASYDSKIYVFKDTDGRTLGSALTASPYQAFAPAPTNDGGTVYASGGIGAPFGVSGSGPVGGPNAYNLVQINNSGGVTGTILTNGGAAGIAPNFVNGHLITEGAANFFLGVPATEQLLDVNPLTKVSTLITSWPSSTQGDGVVVSADGSTA